MYIQDDPTIRINSILIQHLTTAFLWVSALIHICFLSPHWIIDALNLTEDMTWITFLLSTLRTEGQVSIKTSSAIFGADSKALFSPSSFHTPALKLHHRYLTLVLCQDLLVLSILLFTAASCHHSLHNPTSLSELCYVYRSSDLFCSVSTFIVQSTGTP